MAGFFSKPKREERRGRRFVDMLDDINREVLVVSLVHASET